MNSLGIIFGLLSSVTTASSAVIIKQSLDFVGGSTVALAWYNNLLSSCILLPMVFIVGEGPAVYALLFEDEDGWTTFLWGTLITASRLFLFFLDVFS
jgi:GDP-fucose transporter C1